MDTRGRAAIDTRRVYRSRRLGLSRESSGFTFLPLRRPAIVGVPLAFRNTIHWYPWYRWFHAVPLPKFLIFPFYHLRYLPRYAMGQCRFISSSIYLCILFNTLMLQNVKNVFSSETEYNITWTFNFNLSSPLFLIRSNIRRDHAIYKYQFCNSILSMVT